MRSARERLLALADPAVGALAALVRSKKNPSIRLGAAKDILNRVHLGDELHLEVTGTACLADPSDAALLAAADAILQRGTR